MTAHLSRRTLLGAVPTLAAPMALLPVSVALAAEAETPILSTFREWQRVKDVIDDRATLAWEGDRLYPLWMALEDRIAAEPVTCAADLAAKLLVLDEFSSVPLAQAIQAECEALVAEGAIQ